MKIESLIISEIKYFSILCLPHLFAIVNSGFHMVDA